MRGRGDPLSETPVLREGHDDLVGEGDDGAVGGDAIDHTGGLLGPCGKGGFCHGVHLMSEVVGIL